MTEIHLIFNGYWTEEAKSAIPSCAGIYCVYRCTHDVFNRTVTLRELIYIGEAADVGTRLSFHEKLQDWKGYLQIGEKICYSVASINYNRGRAEAALINYHRPPENLEYKTHFPFEDTSVTASGAYGLLATSFTVKTIPDFRNIFGNNLFR